MQVRSFIRASHTTTFLLLATLLVVCSCSTIKKNQPATSSKTGGPSITADPNPIKVCDGSGVGVTRLSWTASGPEKVEVRVGRPDGELFAQTTPTATADTGKWVTDGMTFYLQDATTGKQLSAEHTLAKVTVKITSDGCK